MTVGDYVTWGDAPVSGYIWLGKIIGPVNMHAECDDCGNKDAAGGGWLIAPVDAGCHTAVEFDLVTLLSPLEVLAIQEKNASLLSK